MKGKVHALSLGGKKLYVILWVTMNTRTDNI